MPPPGQDRLLSLAGGEAQATAWWERQLTATPGGIVTTDGFSVEVAVIAGGRVGTAVTTETDDDALARAAAGAARMAASGPEALSRLPEPVPGRPHDAYDP